MRSRLEQLRNQKEGGFTLVELLIVIVILGILAAVVTFGVINFRQSARTSACEANFATIQSAAAAYRANTGNNATSIAMLVPQYISATPEYPVNGDITWTAGTPTLAANFCDTV